MYVLGKSTDELVVFFEVRPGVPKVYDSLNAARDAKEALDGYDAIFRLVDVELDCGEPATCGEPTCQSYREESGGWA